MIKVYKSKDLNYPPPPPPHFKKNHHENIKNFIRFAIIIGLTFALSAQKIAIVDINDVLSSMKEYEDAQTQLDKYSAEWQQQIQQEFDKVKSMYNKLQAEQVLLFS